MLKTRNLTKTYENGRKVALQDFHLDVPEGSIFGLLGPNGAGKTTFIRIINQILKPDNGEVWIERKPLESSHIRKIGYMPEERGLYKNMSIGDQIVYFGELKGMSRYQAMEEAKAWFCRLNIDQWWKKKLSELSKGMAQKIQFVVTVLHRPSLLILDEPFSGFDPVNANLIRDEILRLRKEGTTIILSTHRMESVEQLCDRVALVHQSRKVLDGCVLEVRERFRTGEIGVSLRGEIASDLLQSFIKEFHPIDFIQKNNLTEFILPPGTEPAVVLPQLLKMGKGKIRRFEEIIPSMNEVFVRAIENPI